MSGKARFPFLSTQIINGFFFGVGGTVLSSLIVRLAFLSTPSSSLVHPCANTTFSKSSQILAAFADHYWKAAWSEFVRLEDMLLSQAPLWNGTTVDETAWNAATAIMRTRYGHIVQFRLFVLAYGSLGKRSLTSLCSRSVMKVLLGFFAPTMVILALVRLENPVTTLFCTNHNSFRPY